MTPEQLEHFQVHGYVVLPQRAPASLCERIVHDIWENLAANGIHRDDDTSWEPLHKMGFTDIYTLASMWELRQLPAIYEAFATLFDRKDLWVSVDRVGVKRPGFQTINGERVSRKKWQRNADVHTDLNLWYPPSDLRLQGLVALQDTDPEQGGFACIPGFHHTYREWAENNLDRRKPPEQTFVRFPDKALIKSSMISIPMNQGDLLIWNSLLPHCNTPNKTDRWRTCQYVTFFPATDDFRALQAQTRYTWSSGKPPSHFPGGKAVFETAPKYDVLQGYEPPPLSELGQKLVGVQTW